MTLSPTIDGSRLVSLCADLRAAFLRASFTADSVLELLGQDAHSALGRGEPVPVRRACRGAGDLGILIELFLLSDDCDPDAVARALAPIDLDDATSAGLLIPYGSLVRAGLDIRPIDVGSGNRWVVSDIDGSTRYVGIGSDHVLGVGHASLSLLRATPTDRVNSVLDVGTGCGVQAVLASEYAEDVVATDISERSAALARVTAALNDIELDVRVGSWFDPVAGMTFDRVVANPPFVVGPAHVQHSYRDSGLDLDGASELMISRAADHLTVGGIATMLAAWLHVDGEDWRARVASWLPEHGVDAWVIQRDVADPALYVGTWMRDGGADPRDGSASHLANAWLDRLDEANVVGIGFGVVYLRRTDRPTDVLAEDLLHGFSDPLGSEATAYFARLDWLAENDVLAGALLVDPATALEQVSLPSDEGFSRVVTRLHRGNGPQWSHEIDELGSALLSGFRPGGLVAAELVGLLSAAHGVDEDELADNARAMLTGLVLHGLVVPQ